ncbi:Protein CBG09315 [Caenorhabditis briggsae]|uniref:Protein CBG09315 n=1 Tax=Caenorhabditis briggsae TaxID=6238 RepID=A8X9E0_CAEBR|nr:Protein CBG09315 [Caenorhabditis briggsae]CAP29252.2 Protein CBG09315 [Caenorhabditis briggsae]
MIPEFPLPTVDSDFYRSQIYQLPPIFGNAIQTPQLIEPTSFLTKTDSSIGKFKYFNTIKISSLFSLISVTSLRLNCIQNAVKRAAIRQSNLTKKSSNLNGPLRNSTLNPLAALSSLISPVVMTH